MVYRYIRKSKGEIDARNQEAVTDDYCKKHNLSIDATIEDLKTGNSYHEDRGLGEAIAKLKEGDIIIVADVSRLGRVLLDVMEVGSLIMKKKARLICVENDLELRDDIGSEVTFFGLALGAKLYRAMISAKNKSNVMARRERGEAIGRPEGSGSPKLLGQEKEVMKLHEMGVTRTAIAKIYDVSRQTISNFIESIETKEALKGEKMLI